MLDRIADLMESLRQVSSDIAHDLKTPLTRLRNKLEIAHTLVSSSPDHKAAVGAAITDTDQILQTFSALLRISQIEAGTRRAAFHEVDLSQLFETVAHDFGPAVEAENQALITYIQPELRILGDRELLTQMLANLIENASRHSPEGTQIEMTLAGAASGPVGSVSDDGPGVPAHERERIFRRFYRLERSRTTPGSGLGLSLVAAVADLHRIEISTDDNGPGLKIIMKFMGAARLGP
jgi:signal transduction histidine kinase